MLSPNSLSTFLSQPVHTSPTRPPGLLAQGFLSAIPGPAQWLLSRQAFLATTLIHGGPVGGRESNSPGFKSNSVTYCLCDMKYMILPLGPFGFAYTYRVGMLPGVKETAHAQYLAQHCKSSVNTCFPFSVSLSFPSSGCVSLPSAQTKSCVHFLPFFDNASPQWPCTPMAELTCRLQTGYGLSVSSSTEGPASPLSSWDRVLRVSTPPCPEADFEQPALIHGQKRRH